ncbi:MAG: hypothetical protein JO272_16530 [Pseudonocardiales bacterium]|nr:hypothetical protein [Pseudonocardiales bacterium]
MEWTPARMRRALDQALENASDAQRDRFLAAVALGSRTSHVRVERGSSAVAPDPLARVLHDLRNAVLGPPLPVPMSVSKAAAYLAIAKLATKLGDIVLASVAADRAMTAANEIEHPALVGSATYQVACALLLAGELANAEQILTLGTENIASVAATPHLNCRQEEALSVRGSLLLLRAIIAARRGDYNAAQDVLREAGQLAEQLGCDGNWFWTAFGPTNVAIHQLSVHSHPWQRQGSGPHCGEH